MEKRDYIEDQINQLGKVFTRILSMLTGGKDPSQLETMVAINDSLKESLGIENLIYLDLDVLIARLKNNSNLNSNNLEKLAEIFSSIAEKISKKDSFKANDFYTKSLKIYELINNQNLTYSFERDTKMSNIKNALINL
jgi:hypothetical protein